MYSLVRNLYYHILSILNIILPKKTNKVFFEDLNGIKDNHYVLFNYLILTQRASKYKIIYFTKDKKISAQFGNKAIVISNTLTATYHYLTSRVVFFAYGSNRFQCRPTKKQYVVNLWHGMPLKKVGLLTGERTPYPQEKCYTHFLISSSFFTDVMINSFNCKKEQLKVLGYPRNDLLFQPITNSKLVEITGGTFKRVIAFLPTFRNSNNLGIKAHSIEFPLLNQENIIEFNEYLKKENVCMIIKLHHAQATMKLASMQLSNIKFLTNDSLEKYGISLYSLLGSVDALISDYSSVYIDYLIIDKPIGFILDDLEDYRKTRGFNFEPIEEYLPGRHIYDLKDLVMFIDDVSNNSDQFADARRSICSLFNEFKDNHNCERVLEMVGIR